MRSRKDQYLPLRRQGRQEVLRPDHAAAVPGHAGRADQHAGPGGEAHRPRGRRESAPREGSRGREAARAGGRGRRTPSAATARCSPPTPARRKSRTRARAPARAPDGRCARSRARSTAQEAPGSSSEKELALVQGRRQGDGPTRLKRGDHQRRHRPQGAADAARCEEEGSRRHQRALRRRQQALRRSDRRQAAQEVASSRACFRRISLTCAGLALPWVAFITCPTSELNAFSLPAR